MLASIFRFVVGVILTTFSVVLIVSRLAIEVIGASTAPDDFAALKQRMPRIAEWFFTTPWWVPSLLMVAMAVTAGWLLWSTAKTTTKKAIEENPHPSTREVQEMIAEALSLAPAPLDAVRDELRHIHEKLAAIPNINSVNTDQFATLSKPISWLVSKARMEMLGQVEEDITLYERTFDAEGTISWTSRMMGSRQHAITGLASLGYSIAQISELSNKRKVFISGDTRFATVSDFEKQWWENGLQKQKWYLDRSDLHLFKDMLDRRKETLIREASSSLLSQCDDVSAKDLWCKEGDNHGTLNELVNQSKIRRPDSH